MAQADIYANTFNLYPLWLLFSLVFLNIFKRFLGMAVALVEKTVNLDYLREASASKYPFIQAIIAVSQNGMELEIY